MTGHALPQLLANLPLARYCEAGGLAYLPGAQAILNADTLAACCEDAFVTRGGTIFSFEFDRHDVEIMFDQHQVYSSDQVLVQEIADEQWIDAHPPGEAMPSDTLRLRTPAGLFTHEQVEEVRGDDSEVVVMLKSGADLYFKPAKTGLTLSKITSNSAVSPHSRALVRQLHAPLVLSGSRTF